jgi:UDP-GlcNAc:undecaprenyl-phosphate GlcNAc-1-phosphate transferase
LLLGVPVMDTLTVMTERVLAGRSPFKADRTHLHHRLLAMGFKHHEAVMVIYALQAALFVAAWFLRYSPDWTVVLAYAGFAALVIAVMRIGRHRGWSIRSTSPLAAETQSLTPQTGAKPLSAVFARYASRAIVAALCLYGVVVVSQATQEGHVSALLAAASALLATNLALRWRSETANWIDRAGLYVAAVLAVYVDNHSPSSDVVHIFKVGLFVVLALAVVLRMRWSSDRQFTVNPLDLLVVFSAIAVPNLPGSIIGLQEIGSSAAKVLPLLYGIEALTTDYSRRWRLLTAGVLIFMLACLLRGA